MTETTIHFFASGNTSKGFASLLDSSLKDVTDLLLIQGNPAIERGSLLKEISDVMQDRGYSCWIIHSPSDNNALDGIVMPELQCAVITESAFKQLNAIPESILRFDFAQALKPEILARQHDEIDELNIQINQCHEHAYSGFAEALAIHDDWEAVYIASMSFKSADQLTHAFIRKLYGDNGQSSAGQERHRFLGAATPLGAVDYVSNLTDGLKRYLIKGRAGSGKSTFLKKVAAEGLQRGYDIEFYHCGFDPGSLDMIICRELGFAMFDSTSPHEYFPDRHTDEIIDMYEHCITPGTDEKHADVIRLLKEKYSAKMKQSIGKLADSIAPQNRVKELYAAATDAAIADEIQSELLRKLDIIIQR